MELFPDSMVRSWRALAILLALMPQCSSFGCKSQQDVAVDWFIVYKLPTMPDNVDRLIHGGVAFYYMDNVHQDWALSNVGINEMQGNAVYHTLHQVYSAQNNDTFAYAMYNDETPLGPESITHGHTKGAFAFEKSGGFWLISSLPKFPYPKSSGYQYPKSGMVYGQTMLCVSLNYTDLEAVAELMTYTYPKFYDKQLPDSFSGGNPTLAELLAYRQKHVIDSPYKLETTFHSKGGVIFHNFAKATGFHDGLCEVYNRTPCYFILYPQVYEVYSDLIDLEYNGDTRHLYSGWINERINHNLFVETWQNGARSNVVRSNCTELYKVYNIQELNFPIGSFRETKDHSKWAVSKTGKWICIGDINRQYTQYKRGGSTMCFVNDKVWSAFTGLIRDYETCGIE